MKAQWLLLVHQLPGKPAYLRVKIWRRLREIGAVALKNSIYALPQSEQTLADFQRLLREIEKGGGEGLLCRAELAGGLRDDQVKDMFNAARNAAYGGIADDLRKLVQAGKGRKNREPDLKLKLAKYRQRMADIVRIDFFGAGGGAAIEALLSRLEHSPIVRQAGPGAARASADGASWTGKTWVTRKGVHVDRIACAWLIRRFIDPQAKFKFVSGGRYRHAAGELRFDMAGAEFTHEGDKCSFEVLQERLGSGDAALTAIAEIIHDLDLKDGKFARPETPGIGHVIDGICLSQGDDSVRIARGSAMFDDLYERFRRGARQ